MALHYNGLLNVRILCETIWNVEYKFAFIQLAFHLGLIPLQWTRLLNCAYLFRPICTTIWSERVHLHSLRKGHKDASFMFTLFIMSFVIKKEHQKWEDQ